MGIEISTSMMCADFLHVERVLRELEASGADYLHFDIMDGHFVPNFTMGPDILKSIRGETDIPFDTHLMVYEPERYIETFIQAGSDLVVIHVEACRHPHRTVDLIRKNGAQAGVAINPATPLSALDYLLDEDDERDYYHAFEELTGYGNYGLNEAKYKGLAPSDEDEDEDEYDDEDEDDD